jgi:hypothetical protein
LRASTSARGSDGSFELSGILPGVYTLTVAKIRRSGNEPEDRRFASLRVEVRVGDLDGVALTVRQPRDLEGRILAGSKVPDHLEGTQVILTAVEAPASFRAVAKVGRDGQFRFGQLARARYQLGVYGLPHNQYLASARLGNVDVLEGGIDLTADPVRRPLDIRVGLNGREISGIVEGAGGEPAVSALVTLVPEGQSKVRHLYRLARTDIDGSFSLTGVAPGRYRLYAWEEIEPGAYQSTEFVKQFEKYAVQVSVEKSGVDDVRVSLIPAARGEAAQ